ncbi:MAG: hypothetical protein GJ680_05505 [Alteromonadaceae bacterium]|nr:hypothetical protein [Alteromonadaceae bacterium]
MFKVHNKSKVAVLVGSLLITSLIASAAVHAKGGKRGDRDGEQRAEQRFNNLDTNGDAVLSLDEFTANVAENTERRFTRKDSDEDGLLSLEEATTRRNGEAAADYSDIAEDIIACVADLAAEDDSIVVPDADKFQSPEDRFNAVDTSGDGFIDLEEAQASALSKKTDAFDSIDADEDGLITFEEVQAAGESRKATRQAVRECIEELEEEDIV